MVTFKNVFRLLLLPAILLVVSSCGSTTGTVKGTLCYPSEYIPAMNLYLKNKETNKLYSLVIKEDQQTFKFKKIPEGNYIAFAYTIQKISTNSDNSTSTASGGYTHAVPCGLSVECKDHTLLNFKVNKGKTTQAIRVCDWFAAIVPNVK